MDDDLENDDRGLAVADLVGARDRAGEDDDGNEDGDEGTGSHSATTETGDQKEGDKKSEYHETGQGNLMGTDWRELTQSFA